MDIHMYCDHCRKEIVFGADFYYKICEDGMKHFCSEECFTADEREETVYYEGLASLKTTIQN